MQGTTLKFKYLDLRPVRAIGGRGNVVRLYMLSHKIQFEEVLVSKDDWVASEKAATVATSNPAGHLPVVFVDGKPVPEHISACRYLARKIGMYGSDPEEDRLVDCVGDAYQEWRNDLVYNAMGKAADDPGFIAFRQAQPGYYRTMEWYWEQRVDKGCPYLASGTLPTFADLAVFNVLRDEDRTVGMGSLEDFPNLQAVHNAVNDIPQVQEWIKTWEAQAAAL